MWVCSARTRGAFYKSPHCSRGERSATPLWRPKDCNFMTERGGRPLVPPVRTLKGDRSGIGCSHCTRAWTLHYLLTGSTFFSPPPRSSPLIPRRSPSASLPNADYALGPSSRARSRDHRGTAERAKVERERVSKERPSDAPSWLQSRTARALLREALRKFRIGERGFSLSKCNHYHWSLQFLWFEKSGSICVNSFLLQRNRAHYTFSKITIVPKKERTLVFDNIMDGVNERAFPNIAFPKRSLRTCARNEGITLECMHVAIAQRSAWQVQSPRHSSRRTSTKCASTKRASAKHRGFIV